MNRSNTKLGFQRRFALFCHEGAGTYFWRFFWLGIKNVPRAGTMTTTRQFGIVISVKEVFEPSILWRLEKGRTKGCWDNRLNGCQLAVATGVATGCCGEFNHIQPEISQKFVRPSWSRSATICCPVPRSGSGSGVVMCNMCMYIIHRFCGCVTCLFVHFFFMVLIISMYYWFLSFKHYLFTHLHGFIY